MPLTDLLTGVRVGRIPRLVGVSAGKGIAEVVKAIRIERMGRDVFVMGAANVGKSAFVR